MGNREAVAEYDSSLAVAEYDSSLAVAEYDSSLADDVEAILAGAGEPTYYTAPEDPAEEYRSPYRATPRGGRRVIAESAATIRVRAPEWLIAGELPRGGLALLAGREGCGKSNYWADLAARVTTGNLASLARERARVKDLTLSTLGGNKDLTLSTLGDNDVTSSSRRGDVVTNTLSHNDLPGKGVLVSATEDSWESVIVPRLMAVNANLERVSRITVKDVSVGTELTLSLPDDLDGLETLIQANDVALLVFDPLISRLREGLDTHKDAEVRLALEPLTALAERTGVTILGLMHVNKMVTDDPLTSIMGSRAFPSVARSTLYVIEAPGSWDGDRGKRFIGVAKSNYGEANTKMRVFRIQGEFVGRDRNGNDVLASRVVWLGRILGSGIRDLLSVINSRGDREEIMSNFREQLEAVDHLPAPPRTAASAPVIPPTDQPVHPAPEAEVFEMFESDAATAAEPASPIVPASAEAPLSVGAVEAVFGPVVEITDLEYIKRHWRRLPGTKLRRAFAAGDLENCLFGSRLTPEVSGRKILAAPPDQVNVVRNAIELML